MCSDEQIELKTLKCMVQRGGLEHVISYVLHFQMEVRGHQIHESSGLACATGAPKVIKKSRGNMYLL